MTIPQESEERISHWLRRRAVLAVICAIPALGYFLARAAAPATKKRLVLLGFAEMQSGPQGLDEVVRILGTRGLSEGREFEVVRATIHFPPDGADNKGLAWLVPKLENEVLPLKPDVIVTFGSILTKGMHTASRTIPIVASLADPVDLGVAASLARPGGNVTGVTQGVAETSSKLVEFMKVLIPRLSRVAVFHDSRSVATRFAGHYERALKEAGMEPVMVSSMNAADLRAALRNLPAKGVRAGIWTFADGDTVVLAKEAIAARVALVAVHEIDAQNGCLASYYTSDTAPQPRMAQIVEQILRGADPATIPFLYPKVFRLVINRRTAAAIGLSVPPELLLRADRVIE